MASGDAARAPGPYLDFVHIPKANLVSATLNEVSLEGANLSGADLGFADLNNADLSGADLRGARNLSQEQLDQACGTSAKLYPPDAKAAALQMTHVSTAEAELFPGLDFSSRCARSGCVKPVVRRSGSRRRIHRTRPRRPSTMAVLAEIRSLLRDELGDISATLRRLERGALMQLDIQSVTADQLERVLVRLVKLERAVGICEQPVAPRIGRRWPLAQ
jgi:uncharacterized protein YjbI with pentapeptide repeats